MQELHQLLQASEQLAITAATGMGGIGKTDLAWHYAEAHRAEYPGGIWWLSASQLVVKVLEYSTVMGLDTPPEEFDAAAKVQWCYQKWLSAIPEGARLLVWDDVVDAKAYGELRDYLPTDARFRVLITTRAKLPDVQRLELEALSPLAAYQLLYDLLHFNRPAAKGLDSRLLHEQITAEALCEWLGYLPLAIQVVSSFLNAEPDLSLAEMQRRLKQEKLANETLLPVEAAFNLSWAKLSAAEQQLAMLLGLFGMAAIPWELVEAAVQQCVVSSPRKFWQRLLGKPQPEQWCLLLEGRTLEQTRRQLVTLSLLSRSAEEEYLLHSLIREFFAGKLQAFSTAEALQRGFVLAMTKVAKTVPDTVTLSDLARTENTMLHMEAAASYSALLSDEDCFWSHIGLARLYEGQSLWQQAEQWSGDCLKMTEARFGKQHPSTATSLNNLAELYRAQGRYAEAEPLYLDALTIRRSQLGAEHPNTASSLSGLALLYCAQGRYAEAEPLYLDALAILMEKLGENHLNTQTGWGNFRYLLQQAVEAGRAAELSDHPATQGVLAQIQAEP